MIIFALLYALFFTGIGFFVGKYPTMISGVSTMSAAKRANLDLHAIGKLYKYGLIITGVTVALSVTILSLLSLQTAAIISLIAITFIGIIVIIIRAQIYDRNPKSRFMRSLPVLIIIAVMVAVASSIYSALEPTQVVLSDTKITFTGRYGVAIERDQIKSVDLWESIPRIKLRTNGLGLGNILKGDFRLDSIGQCRLFVNLPNPPFLYIELEDNKKIIFNSKESGYIEKLYSEI